MPYEALIDLLNKTPLDEALFMVNFVLKRMDDVLKSPNDPMPRTFNKSDPTIVRHFVQSGAGRLCIQLMGCLEQPGYFFLPQSQNNSNATMLSNLRDTLLMWKESVEQVAEAQPSQVSSFPTTEHPNSQTLIKPIRLPVLCTRYTHPFFARIETIFHSCLRYADKGILERAKKLLPMDMLNWDARNRLRDLQYQIKVRKIAAPEISLQDMLILELLQWFKESFFTWVNSPPCDFCGGDTKFSHMTHEKRYLQYTNRVELHRCITCHKFTPFARYEDLNILLETRRGRCGEWANVFTLFCRSLGWDARIVFDETDHVWTEVYSIAQQRWLHCDSCENTCDQPLIYESGWKKQVSYVIAYSNEEVQDVTWRYTSNFKETLKRRKACDELALIRVLFDLRNKRQARFSEARRKYLTRRLLMELAEFLTEKKPGDVDNKGRQSGDISWRVSRGETQEAPPSFVWVIDPDDLPVDRVSVLYSPSTDKYQLVSGSDLRETKVGWTTGCYWYENVFRKEEQDWRQVYLARKENTSDGTITWSFQFPPASTKKLERVAVRFSCAIYENATITAQLGCKEIIETIHIDSNVYKTDSFAGKTNLWLKATLSGGKGDLAWQHAQLFRQPLDSDSSPFAIAFTFK